MNLKMLELLVEIDHLSIRGLWQEAVFHADKAEQHLDEARRAKASGNMIVARKHRKAYYVSMHEASACKRAAVFIESDLVAGQVHA